MKLIKLPNKTTDTNKMLDELRITNLVVVCKNKGDLLFKLSWKQRLKRRHSISPYGFHIEERFTYYFSWRERFTYGYHWKSSYRGEIHICFFMEGEIYIRLSLETLVVRSIGDNIDVFWRKKTSIL